MSTCTNQKRREQKYFIFDHSTTLKGYYDGIYYSKHCTHCHRVATIIRDISMISLRNFIHTKFHRYVIWYSQTRFCSRIHSNENESDVACCENILFAYTTVKNIDCAYDQNSKLKCDVLFGMVLSDPFLNNPGTP